MTRLANLIKDFIAPIDLAEEEYLAISCGKYTTVPYHTQTTGYITHQPALDANLVRLLEVALEGKLAHDVYINTGSFKLLWSALESGKKYTGMRRRKSELVRWLMFVSDDVGTKIPVERLRGADPTFVIETSPGNFQFVYVFEEAVTDLALAGAFLRQAKNMELTDPGGMQLTKLVRLPTGINSKQKYMQDGEYFRVSLSQCSGKKWHIMDLARALGMDVNALAKKEAALSGMAAGNVVELDKNMLSRAATKIEKEERRKYAYGDKILQELIDHGMILTPYDEFEAAKDGSGYLHMKCPWSADHTGGGGEDGNTDCGFSPYGYGNDDFKHSIQWHCQHGHCAHRTTETFVQWCTDQGWVDRKELDRQPDYDDMLLELVQYFAMDADGSVYDLRRPEMVSMSVSTAKYLYASYTRNKRNVVNDWLSIKSITRTYGKTYQPGEARLWETMPGVQQINMWAKPDRRPVTCSDATRRMLDVHFESCADDAEQLRLLKAYAASLVVRPEYRMKFAMLWQTFQEGKGKGTACKIIKALIGHDNHNSIRMMDFWEGKYNAWAGGCTFLEIPEFVLPKKSRNISRDMMYDSLKQLITEPVIEINKKYGDTKQTEVHCSIILCSNNELPMQFTEQDRRIMVIASDKPKLSPGHYIRINEAIKDEELLCEMLDYFRGVDGVDGEWIRGMVEAPMTPAKETLVDDSKGPVDHAVEDIVHYAGDLLLPSIVLSEMIRERCFGVRGAAGVDDLSHQQIMLQASKALKAAGLQSCGRSRRKRTPTSRVLYTYWSKPETPLHRHDLLSCLELLRKAIDIPMFEGSCELVDQWLKGKAPHE